VQKLGALFRIARGSEQRLGVLEDCAPRQEASLTFAERSIGLPTTPNIGSAYKVPLQQIEINAAVTAPRGL